MYKDEQLCLPGEHIGDGSDIVPDFQQSICLHRLLQCWPPSHREGTLTGWLKYIVTLPDFKVEREPATFTIVDEVCYMLIQRIPLLAYPMELKYKKLLTNNPLNARAYLSAGTLHLDHMWDRPRPHRRCAIN